jgi:hypothetical protein
MERIITLARYRAWCAERGLEVFHEPDEHDITARVEGTPLDFDNAGFWPFSEGYGPADRPREERSELHVIFSECDIEGGQKVRGPDLACVNLATLCEWALTGREAY